MYFLRKGKGLKVSVLSRYIRASRFCWRFWLYIAILTLSTPAAPLFFATLSKARNITSIVILPVREWCLCFFFFTCIIARVSYVDGLPVIPFSNYFENVLSQSEASLGKGER
jgi:hypothetical protein